MPNPQMQALYNMFRINPNAFPGVNPGAFSGVANDEIAEDTFNHKRTGFEMQREMGVMDDANQRAEVGIRSGLEEAQQVRDARNQGFGGSHPLGQQMQYANQNALQKLILPKQMELQAEIQKSQNQQEFAGQQAAQSQAASATQNQARINAGNARQQSGQAHAEKMAQMTGRAKGPGFFASLFGGSSESPAPAQATPQIGDQQTAPNGMILEFDGSGWAPVAGQ